MTDASNTPPPLNNAPYAGLVESFPSGQITYLAPLPLPTELDAQDYGNAVGEVTDTYMDFGVGLPTAYAWQMTIGGPFSFFCMCTIIFPLVSALGAALVGRDMHDVLMFVTEPFPLFLETGAWASLFALSMFLFITFRQLDQYRKILPTRFNRQRREVCFVPKGKIQPIFVPWESLSAWVVEARGVTPYGMDIRYAMGVGFYHPPDNDHYSLEFHCAGFDLAVCNWEAIRAYMEYEVHTLKDIQDPLELQNPGDPPHEGLHTFYNGRERMRRRRRNKEVGFFYPFWWYLYHVMTLWTLPNYLTEWEIRKIKSIGRRAVPKAMQLWSEPLPPEQWARPSQTLQRLSAAARAVNKELPDLPIDVRFRAAQLAEPQATA